MLPYTGSKQNILNHMKGAELLNGETAHAYITHQLKRMQKTDACAVFMVILDNLFEVNASLGSSGEENARKYAGKVISSLFYASDIVSSMGRDEYLVFTIWQADQKEVEQKAKELVDALRFEAAGNPSIKISACVGVYMAFGCGFTFEKLFGQAAAALYKAKNGGRGSYCILTNEDERKKQEKEFNNNPVNAVFLDTLLEYLDGGVSLIEVGPEIKIIYANNGFFQMTGMDMDSFHFPQPLERIGIHQDYEADYEQLLRNSIGNEGLSDHIHRISGDGKNWVWRHVRVARVAYPASPYPVMLELSTDISDIIKTERKLRESNNRLRIAFQQTPHVIWEVDIKKKIYNTFNIDKQFCSPDTAIAGFPDSFLENGIVHPDSAVSFRVFAENMLGGKNGDSGNFIFKDLANNCYGWVSLSYLMMSDQDGMPVKAIGIQVKLPDISGISREVFPRRPLPEIMLHHLIARLKVNLTEDYVEEIWIDGTDKSAWTWGKTYTEIIKKSSKLLFSDRDIQKFKERFNRGNLLKQYEDGCLWSTEEYRRVDEGGNVGWISDTINLVRDPKTKSIYMFVCISNVQQRHEWERKIEGGILKDPVTRLYDYTTARRISDYLLKNNQGSSSALCLIRIQGGMETKGKDKTNIPREICQFIPIALALSLGAECIAGQYKPDMVYAFFANAGSRYDIKRRIEDAFAYVRVSMENISGTMQLRFIAGTVIEENEEADLDLLLLHAVHLCEMWKNSAMDTVVFNSEDDDWAWNGLKREESGQEETIITELNRTLSKEGQKVAFECVTEMLKSATLEASIMNALRCIGIYYKAARVYILYLSDDKKSVTMQHEWIEWGRQSIRHVMSGVRIEQLPVIIKCMKEQEPILMKGHSEENKTGWNFTIYPIKKAGEITGFLCLENAQEHAADIAVLNTLIPYIAGEKKRFHLLSDNAKIEGRNAFMTIPNLNSYMDVVYYLNSDSYSSMGVLSLDIPDFGAINISLGFEYGKKMLLYISDVLTGIFGNAYIFRTWEAEFIVLLPNTVQEVFNGRCSRLRTMVHRRYPRQVRIGAVWSDGVFYARNLVKEAQSVMCSEQIPNNIYSKPAENKNNTSGLENKFAHQYFVPYFQPKVDMRDGSVIGAEALARGIDKNGSVIPPIKFIEEFEKNGQIRDFDLFMMECVLKQLKDWSEKGLRLIKVSVNISRITLFNPTTLASILAIQSRYPDSLSEYIELEITETAADMENATIASIIKNFMEFGLRFELDDFGSGYANLSIFSNIRFNAIKLDRKIINDLPGNKISRMLVENISKICRNVGMQCIAEGIETPQQEAALQQAGVVFGQGFYYAKPMPAIEFENKYLR